MMTSNRRPASSIRPMRRQRRPSVAGRCSANVLGTEVWAKHRKPHAMSGPSKIRGGLVYFAHLAQSARIAAGRDQRDSREPWPVGGVRRAPAMEFRPPSSCRMATASRRTPPCARLAWS
ncbi:MAG: hypothetical protein MZV70_03690 [Desulfobacterales bacterium]|nr:hypothetical protein [Desulfobacterales bacterium]